MIPTLPQNETDPRRRSQAVEQAREEYRFNYDHVASLPLADVVPKGERASLAWTKQVADIMVTTFINSQRAMSETRGFRGPRDRQKYMLDLGKKHGARGFFDQMVTEARMGVGDIKVDSIAEYEQLFQAFRQPQAAKWCHSDYYFAWLRVAGPNPTVLTRLAEVPDHLALTDEHYQAVMTDGDSIARALAEHRLYICDYAALVAHECGTYPLDRQKYIAAPMAVFAVPRGHYEGRALVPIAIQLGQTPDTPLVVPSDGVAWDIAKSLTNCADGNIHQAMAHLARTHFVIEPFAVSMPRNLSERHPLHVLLKPHFEGTIAINNSAHTSLIAPEGGVDAVMSGTIEASRRAVVAAWREFHFTDSFLDTALAARGVGDGQALPYYPYRDDGRLLWTAIESFVGDYVDVYYQDHAAVRADAELQAWMAEMVADDGGRMPSVGKDGGIPDKSTLVGLLSNIIFIAGPQHAAVNFPQLELMSFAPFYPLACFSPVPTHKHGLTHNDWLALLPPLDVAQFQMNLGHLLGQVHYTQLGRYPEGILGLGQYFDDKRVEPALDAFMEALDEAEEEIDKRNSMRTPYRYLKPSQVPQSINI